MNEWKKGQLGYLYDANFDEEIVNARNRCADLCYEFNQIRPTDIPEQRRKLKEILGHIEDDIVVYAPFFVDYGKQVSVGHNFYANHNLVILDAAKVTFGDNVFIAPNCVITTSGHAIDEAQRNAGLEIAQPVTIGNSVWIGANVTILPGVTIGNNVIIGAGSVVNKDIPNNSIVVGNPCKVLREITPADKEKYPIFKG